jgi:hypothetical protein
MTLRLRTVCSTMGKVYFGTIPSHTVRLFQYIFQVIFAGDIVFVYS